MIELLKSLYDDGNLEMLMDDEKLRNEWKKQGGKTIIVLRQMPDRLNAMAVVAEPFETVVEALSPRQEDFVTFHEVDGKLRGFRKDIIVSIEEL